MPFMIYADFKGILMPESNKKKIQMKLILKNYQKLVECNFGYKLVCVDDKVSKPLDAVYDFINCMIEESKYCSDVAKKLFQTKSL